jgi:hypothetical protein
MIIDGAHEESISIRGRIDDLLGSKVAGSAPPIDHDELLTRCFSGGARIVEAALVIEVSPSFPAKIVPEFITCAKANPGKINYASAGVGSPNHVAGEMFKMMAGVDHVRTRVRRRGRSKYDLIFMMASLRMLMGVNGRNQRIRSGITVQISRQSWQAQWNKRLGAPVSMHCGKGSESP